MLPDTVAPALLLEEYYRAFNERRLADAAAFFPADADIEFSPGTPWSGPDGYLRFAETWTSAFPNINFGIESLTWRNDTVCEVYLRAVGTHMGVLRFGRYRFPPTYADAQLHVRELLDIRDGKITASMITLDFNDLVRQLARVNYDEVLVRIERVCTLRDALTQASTLDARLDVATRLGEELDAARCALRPHFRW